MTPQLAAARSEAPPTLPVPLTDVVMRQIVSASLAMRRSEDVDHILDILVSTALLVVPGTSLWAARSSIGAPLGHASVFDARPVAVKLRHEALEAALEGWAGRLDAGQPPFDAEFPGAAPDAAIAPVCSVFPIGAAPSLGALVVGAPLASLTAAQRSAVGLLCDQALTALELGRARVASERAEALFATLTQLTGCYADAERVLETVVRKAAELLRADAVFVMLADEERLELRVRTAYGITGGAFYGSSYPVDQLICGEAIRRRRAVCVRDLQTHEEAPRSRNEGLRSAMCAPMFVDDELVGVLMAAHREVRELSSEDRWMLETLGTAAAVSVGNARLYAEREASIAQLAEVNLELEQRSAAAERTRAFQQRLTALVLEGGGLDAIIEQATTTLGCRVVILDRELALLHHSAGADLDLDAVREALAGAEETAGAARLTVAGQPLIAWPLELGGERIAHVVVAPEPEGADLGMAEAAVTAIGLELMRDRASAEAEARLTGGLFQELLSGEDVDEATIQRKASYLGFDLTGSNAVIAVSADQPQGGRRALSLEGAIKSALRRRREASMAVFERDDTVYVLISDPEEVTTEAIGQLATLIKQELDVSGRSVGVRIAQAGPHGGIPGVRRAVTEAAYALHVMRILRRGGKPQAFGDLGVWTLLGRVSDPQQLLAFAHDVLGMLLAHDAKRESQLVDTVRTLVECNFHYRTAAELLYTHPNTLRYRMSRIHELTGLDFADADDRLKVEIALRILDVMGTVAE